MSKGANNTGTVYKPKHKSKNLPWRSEVWILDPSSPKGKRRTSKNFKTKSLAEKWRDETVSKSGLSNGIACNSYITFFEYLILWLNTFCLNIKDSTKMGYECYIYQHIGKNPIGSKRLIELNVCDLQNYICFLLTNGNLRTPGGLSEKSVRSLMMMVRKSLHAAVGANLIDKNPAEYIILPRAKQKPIDYLTTDELKNLFRVSQNERWGIFFPLTALTGIRLGEIAALQRNSLKCENDIYYLSIEGSLNRVKDYSGQSGNKTVLRVGETKSSHSNRKIPLLPELTAALLEHFSRQDEEAKKLFGRCHENQFIISNELGDFVDPSTIRNWAKNMAIKAGITRRFYPHMLRKSFATLGSANMDVKNLSSLLGHSSCTVSTDYYIASDLKTKYAAMTNMQGLCEELLNDNSDK